MSQHSITFVALVLNLSLWIYLVDCEVPLVVNTWGFTGATDSAWAAVERGGSPSDAVVAGCTYCEFNPTSCGTSVGFGFTPDENGETTLDAMVYDGASRDMGAVASLRGIKNAVAVADAVMRYTTHSMLVGSLATDFAVQMGFPLENLTSNSSQDSWIQWKQNNCQPNYWKNVEPDPSDSCGPYSPVEAKTKPLSRDKTSAHITENNHDTIGMIAIDENGDIAVGTSTNGINFKIPGRVGDTAVVGAGGFVDNDVGAAVATGDGDVLIRFLPRIVEYMRQGFDPFEACSLVIEEMVGFYPGLSGGVVAANKQGDIGAACCGFGALQYSVRTTNLTETDIQAVTCMS